MRVDAKMTFQRWVESGRKASGDGWPELNKKDALAIIRVMLPRINIDLEGNNKLKMGNFKTVNDCHKWLGEIRKGTAAWDAEMEAVMQEWNESL